MKEIHIECAGAGKTYGIAQKIKEILADCPDCMKIHAITHTNYAVRQIKEELIKTMYSIPDNVEVATVHSFLLRNIIYPYSGYTKGEIINSCSVEELPENYKLQAKRKRELKDIGVVHTSDVRQYARSVLIASSADKVAVKNKKEIAVGYFISDIYCLFVDEAQDMDDWFFELMLIIIYRIEHFYFVGDPFQALWTTDKYRSFTENVADQEGMVINTNFVSRRIPACIVPLCNKILPEGFKLSSINNKEGVVAYTLLSDLDNKTIRALSSNSVFSYIKSKTNVFSTASDDKRLPDDFLQVFAKKYQSYDIDALCHVALHKIHELGLDAFLGKTKIDLPESLYDKLANRFNKGDETGVFVEAIPKIKGLESDTAFFIICNSLLEILLGVKNEFNKETNYLYVALTRAKHRLLFIIDDDEGLKKNFRKLKIDIDTAMVELGIPRVVIEEWFE